MTVQRRSKEREGNGGEAEAENAARKRGSNTRGEQAGAEALTIEAEIGTKTKERSISNDLETIARKKTGGLGMKTGEKDRTMIGGETDTLILRDVRGIPEAKESSRTTATTADQTEKGTPGQTTDKGKIKGGIGAGIETIADIREF